MSPTAAARVEWSKRLAHGLVSGGYAAEENILPVLQEADAAGQSLAALLISKGVLPSQLVMGVLSQLSQLPLVDMSTDPPDGAALDALGDTVSRQYGAVGWRASADQLAVAFGEPPEAADIRALEALTGARVTPVLADPIVIDQLFHGDGASVEAGPAGADPDQSGQTAETGDGKDGAMSGGAAHTSSSAGSSSAGSSTGAGSSGAGNQGDSEHLGVGKVKSELGALQVQAGVPLHVDDLLRYAVSVGASDLHVTAQRPGMIRLNGALRAIEGCPVLDPTAIREMIFGILPQSHRERFEAEHELDTSHQIAGVGRFRVNVFMQRGTIASVMRAIPHEIPTFESLGVPETLRSFTELRRGMVLLTGPTGSGKSTTLATLVDMINETKPLHIISIEDPIEFLHNHKRCVVNQREVGSDTFSFAESLRRVLREDPDVILVGEMRDLETISMAITAAETGHLVFATLHTQDAPQTIDRIVDVFPTNQQSQVRTQLAAALEGVVTQQLMVTADGSGRLACCEVMVCTPAIRNLIRSEKTHQIYSLMQTGAQFGMQTMDQALAKLVKEGRITEGVAFDRCRNEEDLRSHLAS
ncbi:MAG: PilT/PilU family type 4a pilus ATPase [Acidimicrobiales bacterium]